MSFRTFNVVLRMFGSGRVPRGSEPSRGREGPVGGRSGADCCVIGAGSSQDRRLDPGEAPRARVQVSPHAL